MTPIIQTLNGEISIEFDTLVSGKHTFSGLGFQDSQLFVAGGNLRFALRFDTLGNGHFCKAPTLVFTYNKPVRDTFWQVEFNRILLLEQYDPSGNTTVLVLDRSRMEPHLKSHNNRLVVHADFNCEFTLVSSDSTVRLVHEDEPISTKTSKHKYRNAY